MFLLRLSEKRKKGLVSKMLQDVFIRAAMVILGYAFGLFQTAYIYGKMKGIDIREHGSGNAGTTNTLRVLGKKAGLVVFAGDVLKTVIAIGIAKIVFHTLYPEAYKGMRMLIVLYTSAGTILGHNYPFYLHFHGGKGIASTAGWLLSSNWQFLLIGSIAFFLPFGLTHYVSLGSVILYPVMLASFLICGQNGWCGLDCMTQSQLVELYIVTGLLMCLTIYKHRANIKRLWKKEESETHLFQKSNK